MIPGPSDGCSVLTGFWGGIASDPRYHKYEKFLSDGWIPGRKVDISDSQYHTFRGNLPYMGALLLFHPMLRRAWNAVSQKPGQRTSSGRGRLEQRASFDFAFAILFLLILHGVSAFKVLGILYVNYQIAMKLPRASIPAVTWVFNISTLFANELCQGYRLAVLASYVAPAGSALVQWGAWLDGYGGLLSRWEVLFNITILRLVSFNMDYYWSIDKRSANSVEVGNPAQSTRHVEPCLMCPRRSSWTQPTCRSETASRYRPTSGTLRFATTWPTPCTRRCTLPGRS